MGENNLNIRIKHRYDIEANWTKNNPVLLAGEVAYSSDKSGKYKIGDGTHKWSELSYAKADLVKNDVTTALGYTPPTSNTWRGIQNNLTSDSTTDSLAAAQGKALKSLIDGKLSLAGGTMTGSIKWNGSDSLPQFSGSPAYLVGIESFSDGGMMKWQSTANIKVGSASSADKAPWSGITGKPTSYPPSSHTHDNSTITSLDASKLFGTIDIARLPQGALERLIIVEDDTARFKLTTANVQLGDTVKVTKTDKMYYVVDENKLDSEAGYTVYAAGTAASVPWSGVTGKPTTYPPSSHTHSYLPLSGGTLTGVLTLMGNNYQDKFDTGALNLVNSDIYNVNSIKFADLCDTAAEGLQWYRDATHADSFWVKNGVMYFTPNRAWGATATDYTIMHSGNYTSWAAPKTHTHAKSEVGLGNVDNTADANKSVKYATSSGSATKLTTARAINGVNFDGTAPINITANPTENELVAKDLNSVTTPGIYFSGGSNTCTNKPSNVDAFGLIVFKTASGYTTQILVEGNTSAGKTWIRQYNTSAWSGWGYYYNTLFKPSKSDIGLGSVDNTADANKSVKYATSAGNATTATQLGTSAGNSTTPVYFSGGKPVALAYTIAKSVPSNAVFTDTIYSHPTATAYASGLYKITTNNLGHITSATAVTKTDITNLGIPGTNTTYSAFKGATSSAAGGTGLVPAPVAGDQLKFLRADGTWVIPTNTTYSVGTANYSGTTKLYTSTGSSTDGTMTQSAITSALNGKAASGHTHNYAGSSSAGGSANAAVKLATARKIGSASFDGTADITLTQMGVINPIELTRAEYEDLIANNKIDDNQYYNVIDDYDSDLLINDSSISTKYVYSSDKTEKTYSKKSTTSTVTLSASTWSGSSAPYSYTLSVNGVTATNVVEINYASSASDAAIEAYQGAGLKDGGQSTGRITLLATEKPTVNIPITIIVRNDL